MDSPFRPGFGKNPPFLAGRNKALAQLKRGLELGQWPQERGVLITGLRGIGKTVMLNQAEDLARDAGWEVISETASSGFFDRVIGVHLPKILNRLTPGPDFRVTQFSVAGIGSITVEFPDGRQETPTFRSMVTEILTAMKGRGGVLFSIDEVNEAVVEEFAVFAGEYQHLVREDAEVAFIGAGVKGEIRLLLAGNSSTFLRRCANVEIGLLTYDETLEAFTTPIMAAGRSAKDEVVNYMASASQGYPFLVQSIGDIAWRNTAQKTAISLDDAAFAYRQARASMGDFIHEPALSGLSAKDRGFLQAMAQDEGPSRIEDIRQRLGGVSSGYASMYRDRLLRTGLIEAAGHGLVNISFPYLREYLKTHAATQATGYESRRDFPPPPELP